jgi:hypothetical protein
LKKVSLDRAPSASLAGRPVFAFSNGKMLTAKKFNETLATLLRPHLGSQAALIQGHSFRAAIPSAMANNLDMASVDDHSSIIVGAVLQHLSLNSISRHGVHRIHKTVHNPRG